MNKAVVKQINPLVLLFACNYFIYCCSSSRSSIFNLIFPTSLDFGLDIMCPNIELGHDSGWLAHCLTDWLLLLLPQVTDHCNIFVVALIPQLKQKRGETSISFTMRRRRKSETFVAFKPPKHSLLPSAIFQTEYRVYSRFGGEMFKWIRCKFVMIINNNIFISLITDEPFCYLTSLHLFRHII